MKHSKKSKNGNGLRHLSCIVSNISGEPTVNGTKYTEQLWEAIINNATVKKWLKNKTLFGELDHPDKDRDIQTSLINAAIAFTDLKIDGTEVIGEFDILDTPSGRIVQNLIDAGCNIGLSLRGNGNILADGTVSPTGYTLYGIDVVSDPSYPAARMLGPIHEGVKVTLPTKQVILESVQTEVENANTERDLDAVRNIVHRVITDEKQKDILLEEISEKTNSAQPLNDDSNGADVVLQDAVIESLVKEVNTMSNDLVQVKHERDEALKAYDEIIKQNVTESAQLSESHVLVPKEDLQELKRYARSLESANAKLKKEHKSQLEESVRKSKRLEEEVTSLGYKVGGFDKLKAENVELRQKVKHLTQELDELQKKNSTIKKQYDTLLESYAVEKQSRTGVSINESFNTLEEFERIFENAEKRDIVLSSSKPKNSFNPAHLAELNIVDPSANSDLANLARSVKMF